MKKAILLTLSIVILSIPSFAMRPDGGSSDFCKGKPNAASESYDDSKDNNKIILKMTKRHATCNNGSTATEFDISFVKNSGNNIGKVLEKVVCRTTGKEGFGTPYICTWKSGRQDKYWWGMMGLDQPVFDHFYEIYKKVFK